MRVTGLTESSRTESPSPDLSLSPSRLFSDNRLDSMPTTLLRAVEAATTNCGSSLVVSPPLELVDTSTSSQSEMSPQRPTRLLRPSSPEERVS